MLIRCVWNDVRLQDQIIDDNYCNGLIKPNINADDDDDDDNNDVVTINPF